MIRLRVLGAYVAICFSMIAAVESGRIPYPDFDVSMLRNQDEGEVYARKKQFYESLNPQLRAIFKNNYEQNIASEQECSTDRIPRIVHQIWLGGEVPEKYHDWMEGWASLEGWEYRLWTDKEVEAFPMYNKDLYDLSTNKGEQADILRLEILNRYGGLYIDVDYECINVDIFNELNRQYDFYIGFEPPEHGLIKKKNMFKMCNALLASIPRHPIVKHLITNMKANYLAYRPFAEAVQKSGPSYITRVICDYVLQRVDGYRNMYLPCTFFYPFTEEDLLRAGELIYPPEMAGIHYWSGSWRGKKDIACGGYVGGPDGG